MSVSTTENLQNFIEDPQAQQTGDYSLNLNLPQEVDLTCYLTEM